MTSTAEWRAARPEHDRVLEPQLTTARSPGRQVDELEAARDELQLRLGATEPRTPPGPRAARPQPGGHHDGAEGHEQLVAQVARIRRRSSSSAIVPSGASRRA